MKWIEEFRAQVGYPEIEVGKINEQELIKSLGFQLPRDYLEWAGEYESLEICGELIAWNWYSTRRSLITPGVVVSMLAGIDLVSADPGGRSGVFDRYGNSIGPKSWIPTTPGPGGLFPWGADANGTLYLWDARDSDPDKWTVVTYDRTWVEFGCGFVEFLVRLLRGEFQSAPVFIEEWPWIPAIRELEADNSGSIEWHTPARWSAYFEAQAERENDIGYEWDDLSWVEQFRS